MATPKLLQPLLIPYTPFIDISMNFVEGLPKSEGKDVIMVIVDRFNKYTHFISLNHLYLTLTIAKLFMDNLYKLYGLPLSIISDRNPVFFSKFIRKCLIFKGLICSTRLHTTLKIDSQTEIVNKCIENYLRCITWDNPNHWAK
jgi:hypothetical protein